MPSAFHLLVLARVYEVRPRLMRLLVVGSTVPAVAGVAVAAVVLH
jgi:predicted permease